MKEYDSIPILVGNSKQSQSIFYKNEKESILTEKQVKEQIASFLKKAKDKEKPKQVVFLGDCFSELSEEKQEELLKVAYDAVIEGKISNIAVTTTPIGVTKEMLKRFKKYKVKTIELSFYSSNNYLLQRAGLDYTFEQIKQVSKWIHRSGFILGHAIKIGMPESTRIDEINTVKESIRLHPKLVRISPVIVEKGTKLQTEYETEEYEPLSVVQAVERCKELVYLYHRKRINDLHIEMPIGLTKKNVIAGPFHTEFRQLVESNIWYDSIVDRIKKYNVKVKEVEVTVNPSDMNAAIGYGKENLKKLDELYDVTLKVVMDAKIKPGKSEMKIVETYTDFKEDEKKEKVHK